jgi:hypothetical protein
VTKPVAWWQEPLHISNVSAYQTPGALSMLTDEAGARHDCRV